MTSAPGDHARVRELLGREPRGPYEVVVRDDAGDPVVLRNAPLLDDDTPMPTRYWLLGPTEQRRIGRLESDGGVDRAEADIDPAELADAHARYAAERDAALPPDHTGPRPTGGVGGTRVGVKCLHAHWAWHLAGGDDPVGRWIADHLPADQPPDATSEGTVGPGTEVEIGLSLRADDLTVDWGALAATLPVGPHALTERWLRDDDPPRPESLTNALGEVADHLDDVVRAHPDIVDVGTARLSGRGAWTIAQLESGEADPPGPYRIDRDTAEEIFRLAATERRADRTHNPGLASDDVDLVLGSLCALIGAMRKLSIHAVTVTQVDPAP